MPSSRIYILIGLFFASLAPLASAYVVYHPDERHYTDGAMQMLAHGDCLTPLKPDGTPRFRKPILPYWLVAASYSMLGISTWTSRLPFLLAGCAMGWVTYQLAKLLTGRESTAILAALIAMCNPLIVLSSTRSIPDILLGLFLLISAYGFVGLIVKQSTRPLFYWAAYLGAGLAAASKGLPAIVFVGVVWLFVAGYERRLSAWKKLWHTPSVAVGLAIGGAWFAGVFWIHGTAALAVFWNDQVAQRFEVDTTKTPLQFILAWLACAATFLPWLIPAAAALWGQFRAKATTPSIDGVVAAQPPASFDEQRRRFYLLTTLWTLTLVISMALVIKFSTRYLMPVLPLWAVVVADIIGRDARQLTAKWFRAVAFALAGCWAIVGVGFVVAECEMGLPLLAIGVGAAMIAGFSVVWLAARTFGEHTDRLRVAGLMLFSIPLLTLALKPFLLPEQGERVVQLLRDRQLLNAAAIQYIGKPALAGKIRVQTDGTLHLDEVEKVLEPLRPNHDVVLITNLAAAERVDLAEYEQVRIGAGIGDVLAREICWAFAGGQLESYLKGHQKDVVLAWRKSTAASDRPIEDQTIQPR